MQKLRESRAQERLLQAAAQKTERQLSREELNARILEIYGIEPRVSPQLPAAPEITPENPATLPQDAPTQGS